MAVSEVALTRKGYIKITLYRVFGCAFLPYSSLGRSGEPEVGLLFSTFPDGRSGAALLLLRVTVCLEAAVAGAALFAQTRGATAFLIAAPLFVCALCLLIGWMTPAASLLLGLEFITLAVFWPAAPSDSSGVYRLVLVQAGLVGLSLLLSGPGAFSLDACFFGRREIMIPPASRSSRLGQ